VGYINVNNEVVSVKTWIDNPVLGDTLVETNYSDYKDFDGVQFPRHIVSLPGWLSRVGHRGVVSQIEPTR